MLQQVSLDVAEKFCKATIKAKKVPYVAGSPGCGKSAMVRSIAAEANLKVIDIRLAQEDPTTINGFPQIENGRSKYLPPELFPLQGIDSLPVETDETGKVTHRYRGWLIFFDELPSAPRSVQAAAYKIILDRLVGNNELHEQCYMIAAGNLLTDGAIVNEIGTALRSRMVHIHVKSNPESYLTVGARIGLDTRVLSYLAYQKQKVNTFAEYQKGSSDETFACERTWEFLSDILKEISPNQGTAISDEWTTLLQGTVGSSALEFVTYTHAFKDLPSIDQILADPLNTMIPNKPAVMWLLTGMLVGNADSMNIDILMDYIMRLPKEFQFVATKMLWGKSDSFLDNAKVEQVFSEIGDMLLA